MQEYAESLAHKILYNHLCVAPLSRCHCESEAFQEQFRQKTVCRMRVCVCIRVVLDRWGGLQLDAAGCQRHRWLWNDDLSDHTSSSKHVHAPPLYPLHVPLSANASLDVRSQSDVKLTFTRARRTCHFNVAATRKVGLSKSSALFQLSIGQPSHSFPVLLFLFFFFFPLLLFHSQSPPRRDPLKTS